MSGLGFSIAGGMHSYYMEYADENGDAGQGRVPFTSMQQNTGENDHRDHHGHTALSHCATAPLRHCAGSPPRHCTTAL